MTINTDIKRFPGAQIGFNVSPWYRNENVDTLEESSITGRLVEDWRGIQNHFLQSAKSIIEKIAQISTPYYRKYRPTLILEMMISDWSACADGLMATTKFL